MIEICNVDVVYGGRKVFQDFSWRVREGEHWVITGANGSGKTTLLELLAGAVHVPHGHVHYDFVKGETWEERFQQRQRTICYIPVHAIHAFVNSSHNVYYQQRYYTGGDEGLPRVRTVLGDRLHVLDDMQVPAHFDMTALLDVEIIRLSNGQLKKVMILKSLLKHIPRLLLLDYPFEGLDRESRKELCHFIDFIATAHGVQIILTDHHHHLPAVMNKRLVLDNLTILREETIEPAIRHPTAGAPKISPHENGNEPVVEMRNVSIQYGDKLIIDKLDWTICKGERWALTGRNGSGKTTLFSLIYADHPMAYSQQVYLFGRRRGTGESIWDIKNRINYFGPEQINYLNPKGIGVSAREYIKRVNRETDEGVLDHLIAHFDAASFIDEPVKRLSSGQVQLMLLISCFLTDKELLLLDEPFQFLDLKRKALVQQYIQQHLHEERTLVLITHYEEDIARWTERRMILL